MFAYVQSLGCAPNQADAAAIREALAKVGCAFTERPGDAGLVVVLTCGFTTQMEHQNRLRLSELVSQMQSGARLFVGGCLPGMTSGQLGLPPTTFLFGPRSMSEALFELQTYAGSVAGGCAETPADSSDSARPHLVRIATGCMSQCAFCAIPQAAGRTKSRPVADIVAEVQQLEARGVRRVLLTAEDSSSYGRDIQVTFTTLLRSVLKSTSTVVLGIDTLNPKWLRDVVTDFADLLRHRRIARTLYVPIQSGSDRVLRAMGRGYTVADVHAILAELLALNPQPRIITDFIVGFPGESEEDFASTRAMLRAYPFHFVEVFAYTERSGTPAARMVASPELLRRHRADQLIADVLECAAVRNAPQLVNTNLEEEHVHASE